MSQSSMSCLTNVCTDSALFDDVACTVCGCVCDDLRMTVVDGQIVDVRGACRLSESWFLQQDSRRPPVAEIDGQAVSFESAVKRSAEILAAARWPLIYGLSRSSTPGQRAAVRLADRLQTNIDTTASLCHAPSIMAIQEVGESTCTLGEIKNRADLVIFWGVDPVRSHPRHLERYSGDAPGLFVPRGRKDRTIVVIDVAPTDSSRLADVFMPIEPNRDFEAIWALRCLLRGIPVDDGSRLGMPLADLVELAERMKCCRCGVVFFGLGLARTGSGHRNVEALLRLVADLNAHTRFHARRMRIPGDVSGADNVLCWQSGFPFSVNLSRGYPRYNPDEYSAAQMLERGEVDACLLVGSESVSQMPPRAVAHLRSIPTIILDHPTVESAIAPTVRVTTAVYGIHLPGTAYRMDEVPIPLRPILPPKYPSDADVLESIGRATSES
ncbi:MAG: formylmethanofuran dehydrogenase subunit B [Pirellulaceae bacterium]|nr:formylmethanofuran dehydrogenase subunit B [Pirellulaceae bacterium]